MKSIIYISVLAVLATSLSCRKVIKVDLNTSAPKYVIIGNVTDQAGPYHIKISKSINFDQDNNLPGVSNAQVFITDITSNITDTLTEETPGSYTTHSLAGIQGHTYTLKVTSGNDILMATSTLPVAVHLDSLYTEKAVFSDNLAIVPVFNDPAGKGNYYHLLLTIGDSTSNQIIIVDDEIVDGQKIMTPIFETMKIVAGDSVSVELQCIDQAVFTFYSNLQQTVSQNSATPANPQSNITGGALGYFSAHTVNKKKIIAK